MSVANGKWAQQTAAALQNAPTKELKTITAGGEDIGVFYRYTQPKKAFGDSKATSVVLKKDDVVLGVYEGSFTSKKYNTPYYKLRLADGKLAAIEGRTQLTNAMKRVPIGAEVQITYRGKNTIEKGIRAGEQADSFIVAASEQLPG